MHVAGRFLAAGALAGLILVSASAQDAPQSPIGEIFASDASVKGAVVLVGSGMQVMSGSSVAAGQAAALLQLKRGGNVRICPRTNLAISSSRTGRDLMFGMSTGAVEAEYTLAASADAVLTPDFRILLAGPGVFHVAIAADVRGNTCVRSLNNNSASVIISELMGDGTYQVKPGEQVVFHGGKLADPDHAVGDCGCSAPPPVMRAAAPAPEPLPPPVPPAEPPRAVQQEASELAMPAVDALYAAPRSFGFSTDQPVAPPPAALSQPALPAATPLSQTPPLPSLATNEVHVQVDAPFIFSANDVQPAPVQPVARLSLSTTPQFSLIPLPPQPVELHPPAPAPLVPVAAVRPPARGKPSFFGKVRSFFGSLFH